eukprot:1240566-Amphidinium_carterae.2
MMLQFGSCFLLAYNPKGSTLQSWQEKCSLVGVMTGKHDGRTVDALRKASERMAKKKHLGAPLLSAYYRQAKKAQDLTAKRVPELTLEELAAATAALADVEIPEVTQKALLEREITRCIDDKLYDELLDVVHPFKEVKFNPQKAKLSAVEPILLKRVSRWQKTLFTKVVAKMVKGPVSEQQPLSEFLEKVIVVYSELDPIDLDDQGAAALEETLVLAKGLRAILIETFTEQSIVQSSILGQVDVLHAAIGKPGKTITHQLGCSIGESTWFKKRIDEYLSVAPAMVTKGQELNLSLQALQKLPLSGQGLQTLLECAKKVPCYQQALKQKTCEPLLHLLRAELDKFLQWVQVAPSLELLKQMSELLLECSIIFPLDKHISDGLVVVSDLQQRCHNQDLMKGMEEKCDNLTSVDLSEIDKLKSCLGDLSVELGKLGAGTSPINQQLHDKMLKVVKVVNAFAKTVEFKEVNGQSKLVLESGVDVGQKMAALLSNDVVLKEMKLLQEAVAMSVVYQQLLEAANATPKDMEAMITACVQMDRAIKKFNAAKTETTSKHPCLVNLVQAKNISKHALDTQTNLLVEGAQDSLKKKGEELRLIAGGGGPNKDWLHDFHDTTWQKLQEHATSTILAQDLGTLCGCIDAVEQAKCNTNMMLQHPPNKETFGHLSSSTESVALAYCQKVTESLGASETSMKLIEDVRAVLVKALGSKTCHKLMLLFGETHPNKAGVRQAVQKEIKEMRGMV